MCWFEKLYEQTNQEIIYVHGRQKSVMLRLYTVEQEYDVHDFVKWEW